MVKNGITLLWKVYLDKLCQKITVTIIALIVYMLIET